MDFSYEEPSTDFQPTTYDDVPDTSTATDFESAEDTGQDSGPDTNTGQDTGTDLEEGWTNETLPYSSGAAASAVLSDGLHYLGGASNFYGNTIYRKHYIYDAVSETWRSAPENMPDGDGWGARAHVYKDRLYLIGGYPGGSRMRIYNSDSNTWTASDPLPATFQWGFASGIIGQALYVFGGEPNSSKNAPGYKYDFVAKSWSGVAPIPQNSGRGALSSAVVGDKLYVLGGNTPDGTTILQVYDSASNSWSRGPSLNEHLYEAAAAAADKNLVYFFGGAKDHDIADSGGAAVVSDHVNVYDPVSDKWSTRLPMKLSKMWATAELYNGKIYVLGGMNGSSSQMEDLAVYTP